MEAIRDFFTLTPYQYGNALVIIGLFALGTIVFSIVITMSSWNLFKKAGRSPREAFIPIYNLVVLIQIAEIPTYYFFTLLVPFLDLFMLGFINYKLSKLFKVKKWFMWGLILCPLVFLPALAHSKYIYKEPEEEVFISVSDEMPTILSQEEIDKLNKEEENKEKIDNIFKAEIKHIDQAPTYRAKEVKVNKDFINSAPEPIEKIEKVKPIKVTELEEENAKKFVEDEKIEILEL